MFGVSDDVVALHSLVPPIELDLSRGLDLFVTTSPQHVRHTHTHSDTCNMYTYALYSHCIRVVGDTYVYVVLTRFAFPTAAATNRTNQSQLNHNNMSNSTEKLEPAHPSVYDETHTRYAGCVIFVFMCVCIVVC